MGFLRQACNISLYSLESHTKILVFFSPTLRKTTTYFHFWNDSLDVYSLHSIKDGHYKIMNDSSCGVYFKLYQQSETFVLFLHTMNNRCVT